MIVAPTENGQTAQLILHRLSPAEWARGVIVHILLRHPAKRTALVRPCGRLQGPLLDPSRDLLFDLGIERGARLVRVRALVPSHHTPWTLVLAPARVPQVGEERSPTGPEVVALTDGITVTKSAKTSAEGTTMLRQTNEFEETDRPTLCANALEDVVFQQRPQGVVVIVARASGVVLKLQSGQFIACLNPPAARRLRIRPPHLSA
jgi:hypothetical protein